MDPNFKELGDSAFKADGTVNLGIDSCLTCKYFLSYRTDRKDPEEPEFFGICRFPFLVIDETVGLGMICDFFGREEE